MTKLLLNAWGLEDPIPVSLTEEEYYSNVHYHELRKALGSAATVVSSVQRAFEIALEALGVGSYQTPVIMPVTAPAELCAAAIRAGGLPCLLDIDLKTLQFNTQDLAELLTDLEEAVILLPRPFGISLDPALLKLTKKHVTIQYTPAVPNEYVEEQLGDTTFSVYNLHPLINKGAILYNTFSDHKAVLDIVRSSALGVNDELNGYESVLCRRRLGQVQNYRTKVLERAAWYGYYARNFKLQGVLDAITLLDTDVFPLFVRNAGVIAAQLLSMGIETGTFGQGLHTIPAIGQRYVESPKYPVADSLYNKVICLPCNPTVYEGQVETIMREIAKLEKA